MKNFRKKLLTFLICCFLPFDCCFMLRIPLHGDSIAVDNSSAEIQGLVSGLSSSPEHPHSGIKEKPIVIITTGYNNRPWIRKNFQSIVDQDYSNYRVIYIDDASTDRSSSLILKLISIKFNDVPFELICNPERQGALKNIYEAVCRCRDDEIIVSLDGDDWLYDEDVLKKINQVYTLNDIWLTHGSFLHYPGGYLGWNLEIPKEIIQSDQFRKYRCPSHLRTFYAWLFKKINVEDLKYNGTFFQMAWDQAIMFPMIEMAGERHAFFAEPLYVYNIDNPINDNKVDAELQNRLEYYIRHMPHYKRLEIDPRGLHKDDVGK